MVYFKTTRCCDHVIHNVTVICFHVEAGTKPSSSPSGVMAKTSSSPWKIRTRASWTGVAGVAASCEQNRGQLRSSCFHLIWYHLSPYYSDIFGCPWSIGGAKHVTVTDSFRSFQGKDPLDVYRAVSATSCHSGACHSLTCPEHSLRNVHVPKNDLLISIHGERAAFLNSSLLTSMGC